VQQALEAAAEEAGALRLAWRDGERRRVRDAGEAEGRRRDALCARELRALRRERRRRERAAREPEAQEEEQEEGEEEEEEQLYALSDDEDEDEDEGDMAAGAAAGAASTAAAAAAAAGQAQARARRACASLKVVAELKGALRQQAAVARALGADPRDALRDVFRWALPRGVARCVAWGLCGGGGCRSGGFAGGGGSGGEGVPQCAAHALCRRALALALTLAPPPAQRLRHRRRRQRVVRGDPAVHPGSGAARLAAGEDGT
jgi:hypothetical protein